MQILKMAVALTFGAAIPLAAQARDSKVGAASGRYATAVELGENTCGAVKVQSMPTVITHRLGENAVTLAHGPLTHHAVLKRNGTFLSTPVKLGAAPAEVTTVQVAGRFTTRGFLASVSVDIAGPRKCSYIVNWTGTREAN
ncbi:MAG: hypothetical protein ABIR59_10940 [Gemmatimonadales bacterium]